MYQNEIESLYRIRKTLPGVPQRRLASLLHEQELSEIASLAAEDPYDEEETRRHSHLLARDVAMLAYSPKATIYSRIRRLDKREAVA